MKKVLIIFLIIAVVLGGLAIYVGIKVVSGLKQRAGEMVASKILSAATKGKVDIKKNGNFTINGVSFKDGLPDNFPKDFPMFAKIEITSSIGKGNTSTTTASVDSPMQEVYDFYVKNLTDQGWTLKESSFGELKTIGLTKGSLTGNVSFTTQNSKTNLLINFKEN